MSLKSYKKISSNPVPTDTRCEFSSTGHEEVKETVGSNFKSNNFFYIAGLIIFLYFGLKVLDYSEKYKEKSNLPAQTIEKLFNPLMPELLMAKEPVKKTSEQKDQVVDESKVTDKKPVSDVENIDAKTKTGPKIEQIKDSTQTEEKELFFDPLGITSASEVRLLESLGERRRQLEIRDKEINKRELELQLFEKKLQEKWDTLQTIREEVVQQLGQLDKGEVIKAQSLSKVYESMKPKDAARIFDSLDLFVVMKILEHMKEKKLSEILGFVSTERARDITQELALKNKSLSNVAPKI